MPAAKSENEEREGRILDAALDLIVHYGYDKTTVSDIAREAAVSKGAIYLHFTSKDELFEALLTRELRNYAEYWLQLIEDDPRGGTIGGMYKNSLYAMNANPFMSALFRRDARVLGNYIRKPDNVFRRYGNQDTRFFFVKTMQDAGAMVVDIDPRVIAHIMNMLAYGLVGLADVMDPENFPPTDDVIEGIAEIMDRALTPAVGDSNEIGKEIVKRIAQETRSQVAAMQDKEQEEE